MAGMGDSWRAGDRYLSCLWKESTLPTMLSLWFTLNLCVIIMVVLQELLPMVVQVIWEARMESGEAPARARPSHPC